MGLWAGVPSFSGLLRASHVLARLVQEVATFPKPHLDGASRGAWKTSRLLISLTGGGASSWTLRDLDFYGGLPAGTTGLVCRHPAAANAVAQVTVVRVMRPLPGGQGGLRPDGRSWVRDLDLDYRLSTAGQLHYEVPLWTCPGSGDSARAGGSGRVRPPAAARA